MAKADLTAERLRDLLNYDTETGIFVWKTTAKAFLHGRQAGAIDRYGYIRIKVDGKSYSAHRLAWLYVHSTWPTDEIDHINGVRNDNRFGNLRVITRQGNVHNRRKSWSASGYMGVYANHGKWRSAINLDGKTISLGNFNTPEEAYAAYLEAKRRHHPTSTL